MPAHDKHILVLQSATDHVWDEVFKSLAHQGWTVHICPSDVYLVSQLGQLPIESSLCIGSVEDLTVYPNQIVPWLVSHRVTCCAWAMHASTWDLIEQVQSRGLPVFTRKEAFNAWIKHQFQLIRDKQGDTFVTQTVSHEEMIALFGDDGDE